MGTTYPGEEHRECCVCRSLVAVDDDRCLSGDEFIREPGWLSALDVEQHLRRMVAGDRRGGRILVEAAGHLEDGTALFQIWRHDPEAAGTHEDLLAAFTQHQTP